VPRRVFITAAEASGDQHAAELMRSLKRLDPTIEFVMLGGPRMEAVAGDGSMLEDTVSDAAMGWQGALRALEARRWFILLRNAYCGWRPDLHICVDSSAINLPFAKLAKSFGVPVLYYIAPQLWASREGRMKKLRAHVDRLACIFPFEEKYFQDHGVDATFVGHPLFDQLPPKRDRSNGPWFPDAPPVIGIVPGSRRGEVKANLPHLIDVMTRIKSQFPDVTYLIPTTSAVDALVREMLRPHALQQVIEKDGFNTMMPSCDLVITKSGTSTVHVAAWRVPMIVVYRVNPILWHGAARWLLRTKKIAMVNILAGQTDLVPEFIPWYGSNAPVADCAIDMLRHPQKLIDQRNKLGELMKTLDRPGASLNVAQMALSLMQGSST
jgi:lipid-A-disaccharide synthase